MFDSFMHYQGCAIEQFKRIQATYGFTIVDANRNPDEINEELRQRIEKMLRRDDRGESRNFSMSLLLQVSGLLALSRLFGWMEVTQQALNFLHDTLERAGLIR